MYGTAISTLYNCRSDNSNELVNLIDISTGIHSILPHGELIFDTINSKTESRCLTKIDKDGKLNVFHNMTFHYQIN